MTIKHADTAVVHRVYDSDECMECLEATKNACKDKYLEALAHFQWVVDNFVVEMQDSLESDAYKSSETTITESFDTDLHDSLFMVLTNALDTARNALDEYRNVAIVLGMKDNRCDEYLDDEGTYLAPDDDEIDDEDECDECEEDDEEETPCCHKRHLHCDDDFGRFCRRTHFKRRAD